MRVSETGELDTKVLAVGSVFFSFFWGYSFCNFCFGPALHIVGRLRPSMPKLALANLYAP